MTKIYFLIFLFAIASLSHGQKNEVQNGKKLLVIINNKVEKFWTKTEFHDSINWSKVKWINMLADTAAIRKYGAKGKNGAIIVQFK